MLTFKVGCNIRNKISRHRNKNGWISDQSNIQGHI